MQVIGTITANAVVNVVSTGKEVINFDIAVNEGYRNKAGEYIERTQYIRCAVWNKPSMINILTKGTGVNVTGWLEPRAWIDNATGLAKAALNLTASKIELVGKVVRTAAVPVDVAEGVIAGEPSDDLPF